MIAFGVAPGIKSLAYCALEWEGRGAVRVLDQAVMTKSRLVKDNPSPALLQKRFHCHRLILTTVWDRHQPAVLAIGPPADLSEPVLNAQLAGAILGEFGVLMGVEVIHVDRVELETSFGARPRWTLKSELETYVTQMPRDPRGIVATATAVYGLTVQFPDLLSE